MPLVNEFKVGCDPEFVLLDNAGQLVNMTEFVDDPKGEIGYDHGGTVVELHPSPNRSTYRLIQGLQRLILSDLWAQVPAAKFRAGAYATWQGMRNMARGLVRGLPQQPARDHVTLGGHVHLDLNPIKPENRDLHGGNPGEDPDPFDVSKYDYSPYTPEHTARMRVLDHFTHRLEALEILPKEESAKRRTDLSGYGRWGQFRVTEQKWNLDGSVALPRTEYRTMCSWLFDPKVAFLCLTGAKLCAVSPTAAFEALGKVHTFAGLKKFFEVYKSHDVNAHRGWDVLEEKGHNGLRVSPDVNFKDRWTTLGLGK